MSDEPDAPREVLGNLPSTRPARRSAKRDAPAATKPKPKATPKAKAPAKATPKRRTTRERLTPPPVVEPRADAPPAAGYAVPEPDPHPGSSDLLTASVQAGLEIGRLGISLGLRTLRALTDRRPGGDGS